MIEVYTDGSAYPNPMGHGGWAFVAYHRGLEMRRYGYEGQTTNNRMELLAILRAMQAVPASLLHTSDLFIYSDSAYCVSAINQWVKAWKRDGWKTSNGSDVSNRDLFEGIVRLLERHRKHRCIEIVKVKGHAGIRGNEIADVLAGEARKHRQTNWIEEDNKHQAR